MYLITQKNLFSIIRLYLDCAINLDFSPEKTAIENLVQKKPTIVNVVIPC